MKNIHILSTQNESRLYYNSQERTYQLCEFPKYHTDIKSTHNLYITSDEEDVYNKDYYLYEGSVFQARPRDEGNFKNKVILTTDQELIADGVQAIDNEFLEWFVAHPSCEFVEIENTCLEVRVCDCAMNENCLKPGYKIIIPQEEPKQLDIRELNRLDDIEIEEMSNDFETIQQQIKPKQETLEEIAKKAYLNRLEDCLNVDFEDGVKLGAKWQQERSYSEEEVLNILDIILSEYRDSLKDKTDFYPALRFEQFKKK